MSSITKRMIAVRGSLTQGEFAHRLKINPNTLRAYEKGRSQPSFDVLVAICVEFAINPAWLLLGLGEAGESRTSTPDGGCAATADVEGGLCARCLRLERALSAEREECSFLARELLASMKKNVQLAEEVGQLRLENFKIS